MIAEPKHDPHRDETVRGRRERKRDEKALDAHAVAEHTKKFRETFGPFSGALFDERVYKSVG